MTKKELLKNNIMLSMKLYLDRTTISILNDILVKELHNIDILDSETLPATADETNKYILELFNLKKAPKLSKATSNYYLDSIGRLIQYVQKPLPKMTSLDIEYLLDVLKSSNDMVSLNNHRRNLSAFYTWMRKMHLVVENPCESIEPYKEIQKPIDHLEPEETEQLKIGCKHPRDRALLEFLRSTAMRVGEIPLVRISDIDWRSGKLIIYGKKSGKYRLVCLDSVAIKYIQIYIDYREITCKSQEPLFVKLKDNHNMALEKEGIRSSLKTIQKRSGLDKNVYPHLFRKTTATNILKRGGSEEAAGEYLGHAIRGVTGKHYTYKSEDHLLKIFNNYVASF